MDTNELWCVIDDIVVQEGPDTIEKLSRLKESLESTISDVIQNYSDENFEGACV